MMQIFFDLDGTLIDSTQRLYKLFQTLVANSVLTYQEYWELKREQFDHTYILKEKFYYKEDQVQSFQKNWMKKIEDPEWLELDIPFPGVTELLKQLSQNHTLFIVTSRQYTQPVYDQIVKFGWNKCFKNIFVTNQKYKKATLIKNQTHPNSNDWFVGDTGIEQGKLLGVKTAAVLTGFRSRQSLCKYNPDYIVPSVLDIPFLQ